MGEPRYTEKEMVMAKRAAAACVMAYLTARGWLFTGGGEWPGSLPLAVELFPLPKVERPRVEPDPLSPGVEWQVCDLLGCPTLRWKSLDTPEWRIYPAGNGGIHHMPSKERAALWWNLFSHPSEFVDDEG